MFEKLYKAIHSVLPNKGFALIITMTSLGSVTFMPYLADRLIDDYDELRYEHAIQRDRIKLLQIENDSLQNKLRQQSIDFSNLLYKTTEDFNSKIVKIESKPKHIIKPKSKVTIHKSDNYVPPIPKWKISAIIVDSAELYKNLANLKEIQITKIPADTTSEKKSKIGSVDIRRKKVSHFHLFNFTAAKKTKSSFNPDRNRRY
jgi:hypothetical protein